MNHFNSIGENLQKSNTGITNIVNNLSSLTDSLSKADLKRVIDQGNLAMGQLNDILYKVKTGNGTVGKFLNNDSVYYTIHKTMKDLDSLINDLNKNPKRYVHFSVFSGKDTKKK